MIFSGFIWAPIYQYNYEILKDLNNDYPIQDYQIYDFSKNFIEYEKSILDIYSTDDIEISKVKDIKIKNMLNYDFIFIFFHIKINHPNFRKKEKFNTLISQEVEKIKKNIRNKYKDKIKNYVHDIIIHLCDNSEQSNQVNKLIQKYQSFIKHSFLNTKIFLKHQYQENYFTRVDFLIRKYSIEQYLKNKNYDFSLYNKMQYLRINGKNLHLKFIELINSLENKGFDYNYPIEYENNYMLRNGSHRLAYLYYKNEPFVCLSPLINSKSEGLLYCNYGLKWFEDKFSKVELEIIKNELNKLEKYLSD